MRTFMVLLSSLSLSACAVRAPYEAPQPEPFTATAADTAHMDTRAFDGRWWQQFEDPVLEALVGAAIDRNHDVRIAVARVAQARAVFGEVSRDRYPTVTTGAVVDRRTQTIPGFSEGPVDISSYQAGFDAYWELDLFGRVRSAVTAAAATADGLDLSLDAVRVRIVADVARNYFELRGLQQRLAVVERSLANVRDTLRLTTVRHEGGIGEAQDVASARARVAAVEAAIPPLRAQIVARTHRLAVLAGERPGSLAQPLDPRPYPALRTRLALGEAGDLLQRRPDVRAAERRLAAAAAREGVAAADLYPRVTLSGFLGLLAGSAVRTPGHGPSRRP